MRNMSAVVRATLIASSWILGSTAVLGLIAVVCGEHVGIGMLMLFGSAIILSPLFCAMGESVIEDGVKILLIGTLGGVSWLANPISIPALIAMSFGFGGIIAGSLNYWVKSMSGIRSDRIHSEP